MTETKKILLIGRSGRGKSTLANVLINKVNENGQFEKFEEVFKEGKFSVSETREIKDMEFEHELVEQEEIKKITYCIIDTPGIGDTKLTQDEVLDIIAKAVYLVRDGVSRILFVTDGRFDEYEMITYNLLRSAIFDQDVTSYTTIVRTKFPEFEDEEERDVDINLMIQEGGELVEIIESCQREVIHVNNPPIGENVEGLERNKEDRIESRKIVLEYLSKNCQGIYQPKNLEELSAKIYKEMKEKEELGKLLGELIKELERSENILKGSEEELKVQIRKLKNDLEEKNKIIRQEVLKYIQPKLEDAAELKNYLSDNPGKIGVSKKKLSES